MVRWQVHLSLSTNGIISAGACSLLEALARRKQVREFGIVHTLISRLLLCMQGAIDLVQMELTRVPPVVPFLEGPQHSATSASQQLPPLLLTASPADMSK